MLHAALYGDEDQAVILTYAWDRLLIDPVPAHEEPATSPASSRSPPPSRQCRPRPVRSHQPVSTPAELAAELPHTFALLLTRTKVPKA
ncbi:hypothetical protein GCM10017687_83970 [Streptomyces echinatus]